MPICHRGSVGVFIESGEGIRPRGDLSLCRVFEPVCGGSVACGSIEGPYGSRDSP